MLGGNGTSVHGGKTPHGLQGLQRPAHGEFDSYNPRNACVIMCITCGVLANGQRVLLGSELGKVVK